jgi:hypothetical protein
MRHAIQCADSAGPSRHPREHGPVPQDRSLLASTGGHETRKPPRTENLNSCRKTPPRTTDRYEAKIEGDFKIRGSKFAPSLPFCCRCEIRGAKPRLVRQRGMRQAARQSFRQMSDSSHKGVQIRCSFPCVGVTSFFGIQFGHRDWSSGGSTAGPTVSSPASSPGRCRESARFRSAEPIGGLAICRQYLRDPEVGA